MIGRWFPLVVGALIVACIVAVFFAFRSEQHARHDCIAGGGSWVVVGNHYQPPTYTQSGKTMIPVGGGMVNDYGCVAPAAAGAR